jgi:hypothetical protein
MKRDGTTRKRREGRREERGKEEGVHGDAVLFVSIERYLTKHHIWSDSREPRLVWPRALQSLLSSEYIDHLDLVQCTFTVPPACSSCLHTVIRCRSIGRATKGWRTGGNSNALGRHFSLSLVRLKGLTGTKVCTSIKGGNLVHGVTCPTVVLRYSIHPLLCTVGVATQHPLPLVRCARSRPSAHLFEGCRDSGTRIHRVHGACSCGVE